MNKPVIVVAAVAAVLLCGGAAWYFLGEAETPNSDLKVLINGKEVAAKQTKDGIQLADGSKMRIETPGGNVDPRAHMNEMVDGYFKLPEGPQRTAYIDKLIDAQEQAMKDFKITEGADGKPQVRLTTAGPATGPSGAPAGGGGGAGDGAGPEKRVVIRTGGPGAADSIPPDTRAKMAELASAINKRRAERGLPPQQGMMFIRRKEG